MTPTSPAVTLGPPTEASSPPGVSPRPQMFPMSAGSGSYKCVLGTLEEASTPPLRPLLDKPACYMNSVVAGLVWCAREADGLSEDHWSNFPGVFGKIADVSQGGEPLLFLV